MFRKEVEAMAVVEQKCLQFSELCRKSTLVPLLITLVLQAVQNWCGVNVIVFKTVHVFQTFQTSVDSYLATAVVGGVQLLATFSKKFFKCFTQPTPLTPDIAVPQCLSV